MPSSSERGRQAEAQALAYLRRHGLQLVARNWRCRFGELDLIMREAQTLVFVEVRQRSADQFGGALASLTPAKLARLRASAECYLQLHASPDCCCRLDAVCLQGQPAQVQWLQNIAATDC